MFKQYLQGFLCRWTNRTNPKILQHNALLDSIPDRLFCTNNGRLTINKVTYSKALLLWGLGTQLKIWSKLHWLHLV